MNGIYKMKEDLLELYREKGLPMVIATRIIVAFLTVVLINLNIGTLAILQKPLVVLAVSVISGVLPIPLGTVVLVGVTIGHIFAISMVGAVLMAGILSLAYVLGRLFSPKEGYLFIGAFIMCLLGGTYAVPVVLAMIGSMLGVVSVLGGVSWFLLMNLMANLKSLLAEGGATDAVFTVLEAVVEDKSITITLVAIGISYVVATFIKNTSMNESWKASIMTGTGMNLVIMIIGGIIVSAKIPFASLFIGSVIGVILGLVVEIFVHNVNYRGMEQLRFEDDEYFYFVKAIPKKDPPRELSKELLNDLTEKPEKPGGRPQRNPQPQESQKKVATASGGTRANNVNKRKETPQEKRARERAAYRKEQEN